MSTKVRTRTKAVDPRAQRTRDRLGDALLALLRTKPLDAITVQEVLDRAGIARSTFYVHYRDKQDLFVSDVDDFLQLMGKALARGGDRSARVAPVRELFAHVAEERALYDAFVASGQLQTFLDLAQDHFARSIAGRLTIRPRARTLGAARRRALAQMLAGALLSLMTWWLARGARESPGAMDDTFHDLVDGAVEAMAQRAATPA